MKCKRIWSLRGNGDEYLIVLTQKRDYKEDDTLSKLKKFIFWFFIKCTFIVRTLCLTPLG